MKFIGITGGAGAGKSKILRYIEQEYPAKIVLADELAHELMQSGSECFAKLKDAFEGEDIYTKEGGFDSAKLAAVIFSDSGKRETLNKIVHPAVKQEILRLVEKERKEEIYSYFILEAALLIEEGYDKICDELWLIDAAEPIRRKRLKETRGYSDEKIDDILGSQLSDSEYRRHCAVVIENNGTLEEAYEEIQKAFARHGEVGGSEMEKRQIGEDLVFGLDIGTRNVVGTVGYRIDKEFIVLAQHSIEHETRAMLDGQIHHIGRVGNTIRRVKEALEDQIGQTLTSVCVAAAGRVLKTVTTHIEYDFEVESVVLAEDIHTLDLLGIEKAQKELQEKNDTNYKFYCVGYSVVKYYLNGEIFQSIESHKAEKIAEDIIVTFLPEDVIDGLYAAVGIAGLSVANMTLEPIAAIDIAIPENFRMLNIALIDVGAGTSDISVTRDGSIIAYGMIPLAGDEITEVIVQKYLVDFQMAEYMKLASTLGGEVEYTDIMMLDHKISSEEVWELTDEVVERITTEVADKIIELNGGETVKAAFIVGGGGKAHGFDTRLADKLELPYERVALRGEEVLRQVTFEQPGVKKDPLLVTPVGICLNYFEQRNSFIMVHFNGERIKLYDNNRLTIVDAALQAGFPNEYLFPKRGREINFTVNGSPRIARGEAGESAVVKVNGKLTNINAPLIANSYITVEPSTAGDAAKVTLADITDYTEESVTFIVNGKTIRCPKFVEVNGSIELSSYEVHEGDVIETRNFYTIAQLAEFMDVEIDMDFEILVNNRPAGFQTLIYENFTIDWEVLNVQYEETLPVIAVKPEASAQIEDKNTEPELLPTPQPSDELEKKSEEPKEKGGQPEEDAGYPQNPWVAIRITVNGEPVTLTGKMDYIFVDIFDFINFDLADSRGRAIVTTVNGDSAGYMQPLYSGDEVEIYWKET